MKGFTLIELLVVIAINLLLAIILLSIPSTPETLEEEKTYCIKRQDMSQQNLPARCLKYFK